MNCTVCHRPIVNEPYLPVMCQTTAWQGSLVYETSRESSSGVHLWHLDSVLEAPE